MTATSAAMTENLTMRNRASLSFRAWWRPTDAFIAKTKCRHVLGPVDVAQIDDHRLRHLTLQALQIERAELHPFGHDHERIGPVRAGIGVLAIFDFWQVAARLLHPDRIVSADFRAHVQ